MLSFPAILMNSQTKRKSKGNSRICFPIIGPFLGKTSVASMALQWLRSLSNSFFSGMMEMVLCPKIVDWKIMFGEASASKNRKGMALAKLVGGFASTYYLWGPRSCHDAWQSSCC